MVCKNYGIKGHTIEKCYKRIGYPKDFKSKSDFNKVSSSGTATHVSSHASENFNSLVTPSDKSEQHFLTSEQFSKVLALLNEKQSSKDVTGNANMAGMMCNNVSFKNKSWVVDSS